MGQVSIVGERGPELFIPDTPGTVVSNEDSQQMIDAMGRYSDAAPEPSIEDSIKVDYTSTTIAGEEYVTVEQFRQGMNQATKQGAKQGESRV